MRLRRPLCWLSHCALALGATTANAQFQGTVASSVGYSDNILGSPERSNDPLTLPVEGGPLIEVAPGLSFSFEGKRALHRAAYTFSYDYFFDHEEATSYANHLTWGSTLRLAPNLELLLLADGSQGQANVFRPSSASQAQIAASPAGDTQFANVSLLSVITKELSESYTYTQGIALNAYLPFESEKELTSNYDSLARFAIQRTMGHNGFGGEFTAGYGFSTTQGDVEPRRQMQNTLVGRWSRDLNDAFSSQIDLGVTATMNANSLGEQVWSPTGLAALRYAREGGAAEASYTFGMVRNVLVGDAQLAHVALLRLSLPLFRDADLYADGSGGYQYGEQIVGGSLSGQTGSVIRADAALRWAQSGYVSMAARYSYNRQRGTDVPLGQLPVFPDVSRQLVMFTVNLAYPSGEDLAVPVRPGLPTRVDRSDDPLREPSAPHRSDTEVAPDSE